MSLEKLQQMNGRPCRCGTHRHHVSSIICRKGALNELSALLKRNRVTKPFILYDATTASVIGESVRELLEKNGFDCTLFAIPDKKPEPSGKTAGSVMSGHLTITCKKNSFAEFTNAPPEPAAYAAREQ